MTRSRSEEPPRYSTAILDKNQRQSLNDKKRARLIARARTPSVRSTRNELARMPSFVAHCERHDDATQKEMSMTSQKTYLATEELAFSVLFLCIILHKKLVKKIQSSSHPMTISLLCWQ